MSLIRSAADHLPCTTPQPTLHLRLLTDCTDVDSEPDAASLSAARTAIATELASSSQTQLHPNVPVAREANFSSLITAEHDILANNTSHEPAIDLSRYQEPSVPSDPSDVPAWTAALDQAYISSEYLVARGTNLGLLETYGKNAWLIGNSRLEDILRDLEREVAREKAELDQIQRERRERQQAVGAELVGLEQAWRTGVGRHIEVMAACERVKMQILEQRRMGAT